MSVVDLDMLVAAFEDGCYESSWWFDPVSGEVEYCSVDDDYETFESRNLVYIDKIDSRTGYRDMVEFTATISDPDLNDRLRGALQGRGVFRRFKDALPDEVRREWFVFHDQRMKRRGIEWLADHNLVTQTNADAAIAEITSEQTP